MGTLGHCHVLELGQPRCDELAARGGEAHGARLHASRTLRVELCRVLEESANGALLFTTFSLEITKIQKKH